MPRISEFYGIVIEMYFADHPPPHFHARYSGEEATIVIASGEVLGGAAESRIAARARMACGAPWRTRLKLGACKRPRGTGARGAIEMSELIKIRDVEPLDGRVLRICFSNGAVKDVDVGELLDAGGVFSAIRDSRRLFEQVRVNPDSQTIEWPGEIDVDADVLYGRFEPASGVRMSRHLIRRPTAAHA